MTMLSSVTVIISELNSARTIAKCLECIEAQDYHKGLVRCIVIDGGSTDGTLAILERFADERLTVMIAPGLSEAQGHIEALKLVVSDAILFTNSDVYVRPDWISRHVKMLEHSPIVGGRLFWGGDRWTETWNFATPIKQERRIMFALMKGLQRRGFGIGFSNVAMLTSVIREIGLVDTVGHQDTIFAFRAIKRGYKVTTDLANIAYHDHPFKSLRGSFSRALGYSRNHVIVYRIVFGGFFRPKDPTARLVSLAAMLGIVAEIPLVAGVRSWHEWHGVMTASLPRFLFTRYFGLFLGTTIGMVEGVLSQHPSYSSIGNLHTQRARPSA